MSDAGVDQKALWNGEAGRNWVEKQGVFDAMFEPLNEALVASVVERGARSVLDVGCGTGATTLAMARAMGEGGRAVGLDISEPMIVSARENAQAAGVAAEFMVADAQTHAFEPASFEMMTSRFGVMFFPDPVAAFANLRGAMKDGAGLRAFTWRHPRDNLFMTTAGRAAKAFVPDMPAFDLEAPGQFGLCEEERIQRILGAAGWSGIEVAPFDFECEMPEAELIPFFTTRGPLGQVFGELEKATQGEVVDKLRAAFAEYVHGDVVRYSAATWDVRARA